MQNILIKDKDGKFKVLQNGAVTEMKKVANPSQQQTSVPPDEDVELRKELAQHEHIAAQQVHSEVQKHTQELAKDIIAEAQVSLQNEQKISHLESLIVTALRGVRNEFDTKQILLRNPDNGGFGLSEKQSQDLWQLITQKSKQLTDNQKKVVRVMQAGAQKIEGKQKKSLSPKIKEGEHGLRKLRQAYQSTDYDIKSLVSNKKQEVSDATEHLLSKEGLAGNTAEKIKEKNFIKQPTQPSKELIQQPVAGRKPIDLKKQTVHLQPPANPVLVKEKSAGATMIDVVPPDQALSGYSNTGERSQMVDTRTQKRLIGPVDELQLMTLTDFRRISDNVQQRVSKLIEKVELLEEDSYIDRIKGIEAWRGSEVNSLYIQMGYEALIQGKTIEMIIEERANNKKPHLTLEEFFALGELNKHLNL